MADLSDYLEAAYIDHLFNKGALTALTNVYVALFTAAPSDSGGGTEVTTSGTAYARAVDATADWTRSGSTIDNDDDIDFVEATATFGTVTHIALFDALTSGNMLCWKALSASKVVNTGDTARFKAGDLDFTLD